MGIHEGLWTTDGCGITMHGQWFPLSSFRWPIYWCRFYSPLTNGNQCLQRLLLKPVCSCAIRFIDPTYETPSMDCLMLPLLATANLNVTQSYAPNMVVTFQVDPSVGWYEIHARSVEAGWRNIQCGRRECTLTGVILLANYYLWLLTCGGIRPDACCLLARPLNVVLLPENKNGQNSFSTFT